MATMNLMKGVQHSHLDTTKYILTLENVRRLAEIDEDDSKTESETESDSPDPRPRTNVSAASLVRLINDMYDVLADSRRNDYHKCLKVKEYINQYTEARQQTRQALKSIHGKLVELARSTADAMTILEVELDNVAKRIDTLE